VERNSSSRGIKERRPSLCHCLFFSVKHAEDSQEKSIFGH